jgi:Ca2+-binding EF-hand superfamily protein
MVAFRDSDEDDAVDEEDAAVRFYFNMFDIDGSGKISLEELHTVVKSITTGVSEEKSHRPINSLDVETMFYAMDTKKTGYIDLDEFKDFYKAVMVSTSTNSC